MGCTIEGCERPVNRDSVCFPHKIKTVGFSGMHRLKSDREAHVTQAELARSIFKGARETGTDIKQAGVTSPTSGPLMT